MFKSTITTVVIATVVTVTAITTHAGDLRTDIKKRLREAVVSGSHKAAANWAAALSHLEQAEVFNSYNKMATVYGNAFKSLPAVLETMEFYNKLQKKPDEELSDVVGIGKVLMKLQHGAISSGDLKPIVKKIHEREEARRLEWERKYNRSNK